MAQSDKPRRRRGLLEAARRFFCGRRRREAAAAAPANATKRRSINRSTVPTPPAGNLARAERTASKVTTTTTTMTTAPSKNLGTLKEATEGTAEESKTGGSRSQLERRLADKSTGGSVKSGGERSDRRTSSTAEETKITDCKKLHKIVESIPMSSQEPQTSASYSRKVDYAPEYVAAVEAVLDKFDNFRGVSLDGQSLDRREMLETASSDDEQQQQQQTSMRLAKVKAPIEKKGSKRWTSAGTKADTTNDSKDQTLTDEGTKASNDKTLTDMTKDSKDQTLTDAGTMASKNNIPTDTKDSKDKTPTGTKDSKDKTPTGTTNDSKDEMLTDEDKMASKDKTLTETKASKEQTLTDKDTKASEPPTDTKDLKDKMSIDTTKDSKDGTSTGAKDLNERTPANSEESKALGESNESGVTAEDDGTDQQWVTTDDLKTLDAESKDNDDCGAASASTPAASNEAMRVQPDAVLQTEESVKTDATTANTEAKQSSQTAEINDNKSTSTNEKLPPTTSEMEDRADDILGKQEELCEYYKTVAPVEKSVAESHQLTATHAMTMTIERPFFGFGEAPALAADRRALEEMSSIAEKLKQLSADSQQSGDQSDEAAPTPMPPATQEVVEAKQRDNEATPKDELPKDGSGEIGDADRQFRSKDESSRDETAAVPAPSGPELATNDVIQKKPSSSLSSSSATSLLTATVELWKDDGGGRVESVDDHVSDLARLSKEEAPRGLSEGPPGSSTSTEPMLTATVEVWKDDVGDYRVSALAQLSKGEAASSSSSSSSQSAKSRLTATIELWKNDDGGCGVGNAEGQLRDRTDLSKDKATPADADADADACELPLIVSYEDALSRCCIQRSEDNDGYCDGMLATSAPQLATIEPQFKFCDETSAESDDSGGSGLTFGTVVCLDTTTSDEADEAAD